MLVRLEPAAPQSRVKHSSTEPLRSHICFCNATSDWITSKCVTAYPAYSVWNKFDVINYITFRLDDIWLYKACKASIWEEVHKNGNNQTLKIYLGRYIVGSRFTSPLARCRKTKFPTVYIRRYTSQNENFEYSYPLNVPSDTSWFVFINDLILCKTRGLSKLSVLEIFTSAHSSKFDKFGKFVFEMCVRNIFFFKKRHLNFTNELI